jgi:hypothetical protein
LEANVQQGQEILRKSLRRRSGRRGIFGKMLITKKLNVFF